MKKFTLRIPDDLHESIRTSAQREQRSIHGQIVWLLRIALGQECATSAMAAGDAGQNRLAHVESVTTALKRSVNYENQRNA